MVPMKVESIMAQFSRSITNSRYPRLTISWANSFKLPLFRKLPRPSTLTQTAGPFTPTRIEDCTVIVSRIQDLPDACQTKGEPVIAMRLQTRPAGGGRIGGV